MKHRIILAWALLLMAFAALNAETNAAFLQANELYKKGNYDSAATVYESILKTGIESPELYFNMGNAYFKAKNNARAILNYERALKLSPDDESVMFNLELANTLLSDKITIMPEFFVSKWLRSFASMYSSDKWAYISIVTFIIALALFLVYLFSRMVLFKKISFWLSLSFVVLFLVSFSTAYSQKQKYLSEHAAILITSSVTVKSSPDESGTDLFVIHEGLKLEVVDEVGEWRNIKLPNGNKGWLKKSDIELI